MAPEGSIPRHIGKEVGNEEPISETKLPGEEEGKDPDVAALEEEEQA